MKAKIKHVGMPSWPASRRNTGRVCCDARNAKLFQQIICPGAEPSPMTAFQYDISVVQIAQQHEETLCDRLVENTRGRQLDQKRSEFLPEKADLLKKCRQFLWTAFQFCVMGDCSRNFN